IGIESSRADRDGAPHPIEVDVASKGAKVRSRPHLTFVPGPPRRSAHDAAVGGLNSPILLSALPLRVATFVLPAEKGKVQVVIHAEIGSDYGTSTPVSIAYMLEDRAGTGREARTYDRTLEPLVEGVPSSVDFVASNDVAPGEYVLKLVASDGDRV